MMDELRDRFNDGRLRMRDAFVELTMLALRAGVPHDEISFLHGRYFDGSDDLRAAFRVVLLLAETRPR